MKALGPNTLNRPLGTRVDIVELAPIEQQFDQLMERINHSLQRQKQFSSDVAHELRTPLAELRSIADIGRLFVGNEHRMQEYFQDLADISQQMESLVSDLLTLARLENQAEIVSKSQFDLTACLHSVVQRVRKQSERDSLEIVFDTDIVHTVETDRGKLELILRNLLLNAVSYATDATAIRIEYTRHETSIDIKICNHTENLRESDLAMVFERFWRKDKSRSENHSGLGLSLVKAIAQFLNLGLDLSYSGTSKLACISVTGIPTLRYILEKSSGKS